MTSDFLSQFHKNAFHATDTQKGRGGSGKVLFRLSFEKDMDYAAAPAATVTVVNEKGEAMQADYKQYQGETFNVLRIINNIQKEQAMRISWKSTSEEGIRLHDYPYLLFALLRCDNLVDSTLKPLRISQEPAEIVLKIEQTHPQSLPRGRGVYRLVICCGVCRTIYSPPYKGGTGGGSVDSRDSACSPGATAAPR